MTVRIEGDIALLEGACPVEDAETLAAGLDAGAVRAVDVSQCRGLHTAVFQTLLFFRPPIVGAPADPFLRDRVLPIVASEMTKDQRL